MGIKIEFDTTSLNEGEAEGVVRLLQSLFPKAPFGTVVHDHTHKFSGFAPVDAGDEDKGPRPDVIPDDQTSVMPAAVLNNVSAEEAFAPTPPAAPPAPGVEVDKSGIPWNPEYHSTPAKINASDGLWRRKRGVDPSAVPAGPAPIAPPAPVAPPAPIAPVAPPPPAPAAPPAPPAAPVSPTATGAVDFTALMQLNKRLADSGKIAPTAIMELAKEEGGDIGIAMSNPDLCARLFARLQAFDA